MTIIIKIGSNCLMDHKKKKINKQVIKSLMYQIADIKKKKKTNVILVSSGSVASGKFIFTKHQKLDENYYKQHLASIGQYELMSYYLRYAKKKKHYIGQYLVTKNDLQDEVIGVNLGGILNAIKNENIIPIINENDAIAVSGLRFTDNDELTFYLAKIIKPSRVIFLTSVDGVYNQGKFIRSFRNDEDFDNIEFFEKTSAGTGGMENKLKICHKLAKMNITSHIYNGKDEKAILKILDNHHKTGTTVYSMVDMKKKI